MTASVHSLLFLDSYFTRYIPSKHSRFPVYFRYTKFDNSRVVIKRCNASTFTLKCFPIKIIFKIKTNFFSLNIFENKLRSKAFYFFIMEIRERDNNLLYGVSPWRLLSGYLLQNKDVDLCVESYIYEGYSEKEAANFTACDLIRKYSVLTSSNITKKSLALLLEF